MIGFEASSQCVAETHTLAERVLGLLELPVVIRLHGDLGVGKTEWVRGFVRAMGSVEDDVEVSSPSFALLNEYETRLGMIYHWDLYRLGEEIDWHVLDIMDHLPGDGVTLVEWPERFPLEWPEGTYDLSITMNEDESREISFKSVDVIDSEENDV